MLPLQIIYVASGFVALTAGGFQLATLLKRKNSDEFNLGTWLMWTATQGISTTYAISLGDPLLILISASWATFYLIMSVLIVRFSTSHYTLFKSVRPYNKHEDTPLSAPLPAEIAPDATAQLELTTEPAK